ncbi:MAG: hypothetical protein RET84_19830 [Pseudomonadota bacterium]|nr:hypothetical protein [Pseudomonadota bacterium]
MRRRSRIAAALLASLLGAGCDGPTAEAPNEAFVAVRDASPARVFQGTLAGQPVHLVAHDCEVFRIRAVRGTQVDWERVLAPEPYPFFTSCDRQSLVAEANGSVTATLGRMAFGAGGCCATGGTWRSRDGTTWTKTR